VSSSAGSAPGSRSSPRFGATIGAHISIGEGFFASFGCVILDCNVVTIGRDVKFGPSVHIYAATHPVDPTARNSGRELGFPVTIGDGVWVGGGSMILPGVTIGEGSTIGAGSVVAKSIPPRVVAAGVPCRVLKSLADPT
jgi:maltose O-acetyltransferase